MTGVPSVASSVVATRSTVSVVSIGPSAKLVIGSTTRTTSSPGDRLARSVAAAAPTSTNRVAPRYSPFTIWTRPAAADELV